MIITISGALGSGKTTVAKILAKHFSLNHYSTGDFMREMAQKKGITLLELSKLAEKDTTIDKELDDRQVNLGKEEDNFIIDARLGWHFIPTSIKIFLDVTDDKAAKRIFDAKRDDEKYNLSIEETKRKIKQRKDSEIKRYKEYYNINYYDSSNYDITLDTTNKSPQEVAQIIIEYIKDFS
ncbi:AAA family ATPase [Candidatus Woesearchaeota archaeon]|jgi:CMP/dCMP kinase|nr:AAA family ATPase [Candidatus Woesearchaeota archaeon]MBT6518662.1 AAA family ATPase [Candidatus Woesearchaeota archaeon]MBT7368852.1 AAA family ATPase [Candidatus Woesearchaeota archaeon]